MPRDRRLCCPSKQKHRQPQGGGAGGAKGYALFAGQQNAQHGFFYMQAVFGFIKNLVCVGFKNVGGDLLAAVGGQGMLHDTVRLGQRHAGLHPGRSR